MSFRVLHDLHRRRYSRNVGVGLALAAFMLLIFGLTVAKVSSGNFIATQQVEKGSDTQ